MKVENNKKRALIIRYEGFPFLLRMSKVIFRLLDCNFHVDILIPSGKEGKPLYGNKEGFKLKDRVSIHTFPVKSSLWWRLLTYVDKSSLLRDLEFETSLVKLLEKNRYDVIIVKDSHKLKATFNTIDKLGTVDTPVVCDMHENAVEQAMDYRVRFAPPLRRMLTTLSLLAPRLRTMEHNYLPRCDKIFVVVDETRQYLLSKYNLDENKISVVENVVLLGHFDNVKIDDDFTDFKTSIEYSGNPSPKRPRRKSRKNHEWKKHPSRKLWKVQRDDACPKGPH